MIYHISDNRIYNKYITEISSMYDNIIDDLKYNIINIHNDCITNESFTVSDIKSTIIKFIMSILEWVAKQLLKIWNYIKTKGIIASNELFVKTMMKKLNISKLNEESHFKYSDEDPSAFSYRRRRYTIRDSNENDNYETMIGTVSKENAIAYIYYVIENYKKLLNNESCTNVSLLISHVPISCNTPVEKLSQIRKINRLIGSVSLTIPKEILNERAKVRQKIEYEIRHNQHTEEFIENFNNNNSKASEYIYDTLKDMIEAMKQLALDHIRTIDEIKSNLKKAIPQYFDFYNAEFDRLSGR